MKLHLSALALAAGIGLVQPAHAQLANVLFQENFNSLTLQDSVNERRGPLSFALRTTSASDATTSAIPNAYSAAPPTGWSVDNNFTNFGNIDLTNASGTPVFDATVPPGDPPVQLFKLGQVGVVVGNAGVLNQSPSPNDGADEWEGWTIADKNFWISAAEDQDRSQFSFGTGKVAVADNDEYDDFGSGRGGGYYNTGITTDAIPVAGLSQVELEFDSSWRPESYDDNHTTLGYSGNNQTAIIWATWNDGTTDISQEFLIDSVWDSDAGHTSGGALDPIPTRPASPTFKTDSTNEHVSHLISVPATAQNVKFTFGLINSANDWWWAVDNLAVSDGVNPAFWDEDFEGVPLGNSVNERQDIIPTFQNAQSDKGMNDPDSSPVANAFTHTPPAGWSIDNSGIKPIAIGNNDIGVFEWEGWSFSTRDFWLFSAQGDAAQFTKGDGIFAIADSDEFDDLGRNPLNETPNPNNTRPMDTVMVTPAINLAGVAADSLVMQFDSAWLPEGAQKVLITVDYGTGETEVLRWESESVSPFFHGNALNETVLVDLNNPAGATSAVVRFKYLDAGNNWFWAIDNIQIGTAIPEPSCIAMLAVACFGAVGARRRRR
jgi:hypothetical protein